MIIINQGDNPYIITLEMDVKFQVCANSESEALDIMADYFEKHEYKNLYYERLTVETMAECSEYKTAEALAKAYNLTCCGKNHIYVGVEGIENAQRIN